MSFLKKLWHPKKEGEDSPAVFISPVDLFRHSFLAGATFALGAAAVILDITCVILLSFGYGYARSWAQDSNLLLTLSSSPLAGIVASLLATCLWYGMQLCLTVDILLALSTTSRELQEGSVYSYGIVTMWQIPLMFVCLGFQLSPSNRDWVKQACTLLSLAPSCDDWWKSVKAAALAPTIVALLLHLALFLSALIYCRTRSAKSLRPPRAKEVTKRKGTSSPASKPLPKPSSYPSHQSESGSDAELTPSGRPSADENPPWLLQQTKTGAIVGRTSPARPSTQLELGKEEEGRASRGSRSRSRRSSPGEESDEEALLSDDDGEQNSRRRRRSG